MGMGGIDGEGNGTVRDLLPTFMQLSFEKSLRPSAEVQVRAFLWLVNIYFAKVGQMIRARSGRGPCFTSHAFPHYASQPPQGRMIEYVDIPQDNAEFLQFS
jgi:hypothetical protein